MEQDLAMYFMCGNFGLPLLGIVVALLLRQGRWATIALIGMLTMLGIVMGPLAIIGSFLTPRPKACSQCGSHKVSVDAGFIDPKTGEKHDVKVINWFLGVLVALVGLLMIVAGLLTIFDQSDSGSVIITYYILGQEVSAQLYGLVFTAFGLTLLARVLVELNKYLHDPKVTRYFCHKCRHDWTEGAVETTTVAHA